MELTAVVSSYLGDLTYAWYMNGFDQDVSTARLFITGGGICDQNNDHTIPGYWKDGVWIQLPTLSSYGGYATSLEAWSDDEYAGGHITSLEGVT